MFCSEKVYYNPYGHENNPFGSSKALYNYLSCWEAPDGNKDNSYLTFFSSGKKHTVYCKQILCIMLCHNLGGIVFGIVNLVGNFGTVFCDQAYWQSSVAAKPLQVISHS